jgi:hypothetical protein
MKHGNQFGEEDQIRNHYNELAVTLTQKENRQTNRDTFPFDVRWRLIFVMNFQLKKKSNLLYNQGKEPSLPWREIILLLIPGDYDTQE